MLHSRQHEHSGKTKCMNMCPGRVNPPAVESKVHCIAIYIRLGQIWCMYYVTHINRGLGHTKTAKGEYCIGVPDHSKVDLQFFKRITLINMLFSEWPPSVYKITIRRASFGVSYISCEM